MAKETGRYTTGELIRDLWHWIGPDRGRFFGVSALRLLTDVAGLYPAYAAGKIVTFLTHYSAGAPLAPLYWLIGTLIGLSVARSVVRYYVFYNGYQVSEKTGQRSAIETISRLLKLDLAWQESESSGAKLKRISRGSSSVDNLLRSWIRELQQVGVTFIGVTVILFSFSPAVAAFLVIAMVLYYLGSLKLTGRAVSASDEVNKVEDDIGGLTFEVINNIRTAKVLGFTGQLMARIRQAYDQSFERIKIRVFRFQTRNVILGLATSVVEFIGLIAIVIGVLHGRYEVGFLVIFTGYFNQIQFVVSRFANQTQEFLVDRAAVARMVDILRQHIPPAETGSKHRFPAHWRQIEVKHLRFGYNQNDVIHDVSFSIERGQKIGLVGSSGAGKSTVFKLLLKEYEDYQGLILVDGLTLKTMSLVSYYDRTAVVLQDTEVFDFSLRENITIANQSKAGDEKLLKTAMKIAHIDDFLDRLPHGLDTQIGEKGVKLSGGERQRVGIARAVFKQPDLLFLDEATSHLDVESEEDIKDSLSKVFKSVTAVVIAHRLTTIREMDRILVLEDGKILEQGTFNYLMRKKGRFHELWQKQKF